MRVTGQSTSRVSQGFGAERNLLVRKVHFGVVYYSNGNSLPVFSIPVYWGYFGLGWKSASYRISGPTSRAANRSIGSLFGGNEVCAPHLLKADLSISKQAKSGQGHGLFALHPQDVKSCGQTATGAAIS
jgi:hypothetical protein